MNKLTLLQQALIEEKKLNFEKLQKKLKKKTKPSDLLKELLPNYKPQPKQLKFHNSNAFEKGLKGGYGSGKTIALCAEAILLSFVNRPLSVVISSTSEDNIKLTTHETIKNLLKENNIEYQWLETKGHFKIYFGQKDEECGNIFLIGQKFFKGPNVAAVGFDEPFSQRKETYDNLIARVRNPKSKRLEVFWAGTAEPDKMEWGFEYFEKDENTTDLFTITIPTKENKFAEKSFVNNLKRKYTAKMQEIYLEGKLILLSQLPVYHAFDRSKNLINPSLALPFDKGEGRGGVYNSFDKGEAGWGLVELILSFDFNVNPMTCVLVVYKKGIFYQTKEFSISNSNTIELCAAVIAYLNNQSFFESYKKSIIITGDATGRKRGTRGYKSDYEIIRDEFTKAEIDFYFNIPVENPAVRDRVNYVNKLFEAEQYFIFSDCSKSIKDRELVSWKDTGEGFIIDKSKKDLTHLSDCGDYAVFNNQILLDNEDELNSVYLGFRER